ncbi:MAG TPA: M48 family metalloprotease [Gemmatimonadales bacterium]|nr:M48 family metalloprotease [Gemmatimonadales bacterium]
MPFTLSRVHHRPVVAAILAAAMAAACATNPATGKKELILVSEDQEVQMGQAEAKRTISELGAYDEAGLQSYVSSIGMKLAAASERPQLPWSFTIVDDPQVNAFALPGGPIFVTRGILAHMGSEAELAGVLGHEIGHVTARHSASQMSRAQLAQIGLGLGTVLRPDLAQFAGLASSGLQVLFLKYGRDDESEADMLGFRYSVRTNYDPHAMLDLFRMLQGVEVLAGQGRVPGWLTTHPFPEDRLSQTEKRLASTQVDYSTMVTNRDAFRQHLDGIVYGDDPRHGYFDGQAFYHPELKFQLVFPQGWSTRNGVSAVTGISPKEDAIVQLGLAGSEAPRDLLQKFLAQEGVQAGQTSNASINGLPAATARFSANTQQGQVQGRVGFIQLGGRTYSLIAYAPAAQAAGYDEAFRQWMGSFRSLTDAKRLNVQPARVRIVKLPSGMTLAEFNQRYPSVIPIERLALLNGVAADGRLEAGTLAKRVVK